MASFWESVKSFLHREVADLAAGVDTVRDKLDAELTKREQELEATPSERIAMLQSEMSQTDDVFDRLEAEIEARSQPADGTDAANTDVPGNEPSSGAGGETA